MHLFKCAQKMLGYCNGLNNRGGQKGGLHPITNIHGCNSCGGQNLGQTQAEHANLIDHERRRPPLFLCISLACSAWLRPRFCPTQLLRPWIYVIGRNPPFCPPRLFSPLQYFDDELFLIAISHDFLQGAPLCSASR